MRFLLSLFLMFSMPLMASPLQVDGTRFINGNQEQVLLRGINVTGAAKIPPFRGIAGPEDFAPLPRWGFNTVRLLFIWEALESTKGLYDEDYLQYYVNMVRWAAQNHLYVIVDIHQDAYSRFALNGCGEGFPSWTIPSSKPLAVPKNDASCKSWGSMALFSTDMQDDWTAFYQNHGGVRDSYLAMVKKLASAVQNEPNVVGIDLLNEPWGDEKTDLYDLYVDAAAAVRSIMPGTLVFTSAGSVSSSGLVKSALPRVPGANIVHETHFYDPGIVLHSWSQWALDVSVKNWEQVKADWGTPIFLGEFGANSELKDGAAYLDAIYDRLDAELFSGAIWVYTPTWNNVTKDGWNIEDFSINDDRGRLRGLFHPRPWVERVTGALTYMKWNAGTQTLDVSVASSGATAGLMHVIVPEGFEFNETTNPSVVCVSLADHSLDCSWSAADQASTQATNLSLLFRSAG